MRRLIQFVLLLTCAVPAFGTTYYVSKSLGLDTHTSAQAQSKSTPWAHMPGMPSCTSSCASYNPAPGDSIILYGGDTWTSSDLGVNWTWSGSSGSAIYIGVDVTWYNSSVCGASFCRPIFSCGGGTCSGSANAMIQIGGGSNVGQYTVWDNIEMTARGLSDGRGYFQAYADNVTAENFYVHGWNHTGETGDTGFAFTNTTCCGATGVGMVFDHDIVDGSDTTKDSLVCFFGIATIIENSVCNWVTNGAEGSFDQVHDSLFENLPVSFSAGAHQNAIQQAGNAHSSTNFFYNDVITGVQSGGITKLWLGQAAGGANLTVYAFDNLLFSNVAGNDVDTCQLNSGNCGTYTYFNNTFECGNSSGVGGCQAGSGSLPPTQVAHWINNHCIATSCVNITGDPNYSYTETNSLIQSVATASGQGYTAGSTFAFQPTLISGGTVGAGTNEQSLCTTINSLDTNAGTACKYDTGYACTYNTSNHTVSCPDRAELARPVSAAWDIGAYQYPGVTVALPVFTPPTGTQFANGQIVTITSSTSGATLCYTLDGSTPTATTPGTCSHGTTLTNGGTVNVSATETVNVLGTLSGDTNSSVASASFTVGGGVTSNIDDIPPTSSGSPAIGWATPPYVDTGCGDPTGPTSYPHTIGNTSPSLDGFSSLFTLVSAPEGCVGWFYNSGPQDLGTVITNDFQYYSGSTNSSGNANEFDVYQYVKAASNPSCLAHDTDFYFGTQCVTSTGDVQIWDQGAKAWHNTSPTISCASGFATGAWHHITMNDHWTCGDTSGTGGYPKQCYDTIIIDGVQHTINNCYSSGALPGGYSENSGANFELDVGSAGTTLTANLDEASLTFTQNPTITVTDAGGGSVADNQSQINCPGTCVGSYTSGTVVVLTATPSSGYAFSGWSGAGCSGIGTCTITATGASAVTATFTASSGSISVTLSGTGIVTSSPIGINCPGDVLGRIYRQRDVDGCTQGFLCFQRVVWWRVFWNSALYDQCHHGSEREGCFRSDWNHVAPDTESHCDLDILFYRLEYRDHCGDEYVWRERLDRTFRLHAWHTAQRAGSADEREHNRKSSRRHTLHRSKSGSDPLECKYDSGHNRVSPRPRLESFRHGSVPSLQWLAILRRNANGRNMGL